ncbi:hypothetical protein CERSUDRAFT_112147 [Gelatoporia subvermispora B]|uniref:MSP domain-containing protein n=1 Tax=Ceriporiopsis subvermispora (strain B) TaxID=914234 RepID=M2PT78_CERS8|nr:hypothetical protein CERSUDRAFT_112147 [Gelatoporia subvermispora B]
MSVSLNPGSALGFNRPLTQHVKRTLAITNPNAQPIAFKVKTTAPKLYCVRPNSGRVEPGETVEVQVMLQAMKEEPPLNAKCKDKFLIQSTPISPEKETMSLQDIWNDANEDVHSQKIRVVYLPPEGQTVPEEDEGLPQSDLLAGSRQYPEGNGHAAAPSTRELSGMSDGALPPHHEEEHHVDARSTPPPNVSALQHDTSVEQPQHSAEESTDSVGIVNVNVHPPPSPAPPVPATIPDEKEELAGRLRSAESEIERLRKLISSMPAPSDVGTTTTSPGEFRRRRAFSDDTSTLDGETEVGTYIEDAVAPPQEGVPLQVVIIMMLGVFITTYLFF